MTLLSAPQPLNSVYDAALLDLDGVVYIGPRAVPAAPEAVDKARAAGMKVAFVTNNAARTPARTAERLTGMGVAAAPEDVVTSAEAAARLVADRFPAGSPVLAVGDTGLRLALRRRGLRPVSVAAERPVAVVQGYSPRLTYDLMVQGALAVAAGALFVATNNDTTAPLEHGIQPGNGSAARVIAHATGREPVVAGKPARPLHEEGVLRTGAVNPLVVGDRLDTDIEGATARGAASMLVLSGVTTPLEAVCARPEHRPSYLAWDLAGINQTHPEVAVTAPGTATCAGWTAAAAGDTLALTGDGDRLDGLRAVCAAAWSVFPDTAPPQAHAARALARLEGPRT
ncbi:HAD-IIA family hydrolase [Streptomonospora nanhaiensis]|uniref:HAD-IIA family hydrolase n=1 Tax=Streptomonospora nanhaiensis TaxID=1323731 RepID=UPI001C384A77|nr:HAD-IIA family hydrolase [Streptomonospora nanhaiensis]MBV2365696.1 HAD-IIA family hydrolase [Streptomonospora nanhaiensis]